jgi:anhydro-N-acetylmuramic acid kinase
MDGWCHRHRGEAFDRDGQWASTGTVQAALLDRLLDHPFFQLTPPKSTGRDDFHLDGLDEQLKTFDAISPADVQRTLLELTARSIADAVVTTARTTRGIYLCGGGAYNAALRNRLAELLSPRTISTTEDLGIAADQVEATAFAWLALQTLEARPGNVPEVTGARGPRVLGAIYPR